MQTPLQAQKSLQEIQTWLMESIAQKLGFSQQDIDPHKPLTAYGLDSLRAVEISRELGTWLGRELPAYLLLDSDRDSIDSLAQYLASPAPIEIAASQVIESPRKPTVKQMFNQLWSKSSQLVEPICNRPAFNRAVSKALSLVQKTATPQIAATCSTFPPNYYPQEQLISIFSQNLDRKDLDLDIENIIRFFTNVTIRGRHFGLSPDWDGAGERQTLEAAIDIAVDLAEKAVGNLLEKTGLAPDDISQLVDVTILPATPSIGARLMSRIPFPANIKRMSLYGVGCMNGVHALARIQDYLKAHPQEAVILISVELASVLWQGSFQKDLQFYLEQLPSNPQKYEQMINMTLVTAALFGDGAIAVLAVGAEHPLARPGQPQIIDSRSNVVPDTVDLIGVDISIERGNVRATVKPEVPDLLPDAIRQTIEPLLAQSNLSIRDVSHWLIHPGGPKIVKAIEEAFELDENALWLSYETLAQVGNLSSAHALYMLEQLLVSDKSPAPGDYGLLVAMGPGLSQESVLLKW